MENTDRQVRQHSEQNHVKVLMQRDQVSHLIGKGGAVIKEFVRRSGAFIKFETPTQGSPRQVSRL